jgi:hypothetical protein
MNTGAFTAQIITNKTNFITTKGNNDCLYVDDLFLSYKDKNLFTGEVSDSLAQLLRTNIYNKKTFHYGQLYTLKNDPINLNLNLNLTGCEQSFDDSSGTKGSLQNILNKYDTAKSAAQFNLNTRSILITRSNDRAIQKDLETFSILFKK